MFLSRYLTAPMLFLRHSFICSDVRCHLDQKPDPTQTIGWARAVDLGFGLGLCTHTGPGGLDWISSLSGHGPRSAWLRWSLVSGLLSSRWERLRFLYKCCTEGSAGLVDAYCARLHMHENSVRVERDRFDNFVLPSGKVLLRQSCM